MFDRTRAKFTAPVQNTAALAIMALVVALIALAMSVGVK
jgi:hypothetical protein